MPSTVRVVDRVDLAEQLALALRRAGVQGRRSAWSPGWATVGGVALVVGTLASLALRVIAPVR